VSLIRLDDRTRGLVYGPALIASALPGAGRLIVSKRNDWSLSDLILPETWAPVRRHWKLVVRAREGGEILWVRPFVSEQEVVEAYIRAIGLNIDRLPDAFRLPSTWIDGELEIQLATVATFNATNSTNADWGTGNRCPAGVTTTDYLNVAGGGAGGAGAQVGGGGGAGGMRTGNHAVTPGVQYTITVGPGGTAVAASDGNPGNDSVFDTITSNKGGGGGIVAAPTGTLGSGGGGGGNGASGGSGTPASGTGGQGNNGGTGFGNAGNRAGAGGGGATAVGADGTPSGGGIGGNGGAGTSSSISGSSVPYAGGGGGASQSGTPGNGGTGGGGNGGVSAAGTAGTANTGGGGGSERAGGSGVIILSFTPALSRTIFKQRARFFTRRF
jgi:hypothetical protein